MNNNNYNYPDYPDPQTYTSCLSVKIIECVQPAAI